MNLQCTFCLNPSDRIAYYSKDYMGVRTIENPSICCKICYDSPRIMTQISPLRGGNEGIYCFLFESIGKWDKKTVAYHVAKKGWQINHLNERPWKKLMWHIHYKFTQKGQK